MDIKEVMLILNKGLKYDKLWADYNRRFRPETTILKLSERTPEQSLIDLQAKYDALQASHVKLVEALEGMKKYSSYIRPDGHPHKHFHGGCIWCDIDQAIAEAEKIT